MSMILKYLLSTGPAGQARSRVQVCLAATLLRAIESNEEQALCIPYDDTRYRPPLIHKHARFQAWLELPMTGQEESIIHLVCVSYQDAEE